MLLFQEFGRYLIKTFFQVMPFVFLAIAGIAWWAMHERKDNDNH